MQSPEEAAADLTELLLPLMRYRISRLGVDGSGAFNFYRHRLETGRVFCEYELGLVNVIVNHKLPVRTIHEIGCGWGQLVFLLAWLGHRTTGFEVDARRAHGAKYFLAILKEIDPERAEYATIRHEAFPPAANADFGVDLVIATNIITDDAPLYEPRVLEALPQYRYALIDLDRFCRLRAVDQRPGLVAQIKATGLRSNGLVCDMRQDGHYYLFERSQQKPRLTLRQQLRASLERRYGQ